ncbi:MAG: DUF2270 domain-containing protein [Myxococcaceae bacterium]|nr:DUF2270 domain-containing protein [Myxococcaceae bacterium]
MSRETSKRDTESPGLSPMVMAHLFRGELSRSDTWRTRLDTTMNWALTTTGAVLSFSFGSTASTHVVLLVGLWLNAMFLLLEARRYRYYDLWNRRVRLIEGGYWAPMLRREPVDPDALRELAAELARPQLQLTWMSAISTRLVRAYGPLMTVLLVSWFAKVYGHPRRASSWHEFFERAHVGPVPGPVVVGILVVVTLLFALLFITALVARQPLGELRPRPRSRQMALWEAMFRPYAVPPPTTRASRRQRPTPQH